MGDTVSSKLSVMAAIVVLLIPVVAVASTGTGELTLLSTSGSGEKADLGMTAHLDISDDGSVVIFGSNSTNLIEPNLPSPSQKVYAKDVLSGLVTLVDSLPDGTPSNGLGHQARVSRNGRYVVFVSRATNLSPDDNDTDPDLYVKDLETGAITLASTDANGVKGNQSFLGGFPVISSDGNLVVFATNGPLDPAHPQKTCFDDYNNEYYDCTEIQVYAKRLDDGSVSLLTDPASSLSAISGTISLDLNGDGTKVALATFQQLAAADADTGPDIYVIDLASGTATLASTHLSAGTSDPNVNSAHFPSMSSDGSRVVFQGKSQVWPGNAYPTTQVFLKDLISDSLSIVSTAADGSVANALSQDPIISADGQFVSFSSNGTNLDPSDGDSIGDIYLKALSTGEVWLISQTDDGIKGDNSSFISAPVQDGSAVFFSTSANNLSPLDTDQFAYQDLYKKTLPVANVDANGDGIADSLQPPGTGFGEFNDASTTPPTTGSIVNTEGLDVFISDATDLADGVLITVGPGTTGRVTLSVCGFFTLRLDPGTEMVLTCSSVIVEVITGAVTIEPSGDGITTISVPSGVKAEVSDPVNDDFTVTHISGSSAITIVVAGVEHTLEAGDPPGSFTSNAPPTIDQITAPVDPVAIEAQPITASVSFSDPGIGDTHTCQFVWDDGTTTSLDAAGLQCESSHTYTQPGVYNLTVIVTDDAGDSDTTVAMVVVYDPEGGFVTGGGWIDSPLGAYAENPDLVGKANFGFVSRYKKGATVPDGNTEFRFSAGDLNFHSTEYEWLVVTGSDSARFKGTGTVNGEGAYKFTIWAQDGDTDTFRIRIWVENEDGTETDVYDNGSHQPIAGGSVVVHSN